MGDRHRLIDITLPVSQRLPVWPGDAPVRIARSTDLVTISELHISSHSGTHLDAPAHFIQHGRTVDQLPLEVLIGPAWVCDCSGAGSISAALLDRSGIPRDVRRLLLKTSNSDRPWLRPSLDNHKAPAAAFDTDFIALDASAAEWMLARGVKLVGVDGPSVDPYGSDFPVHHLLLTNEVVLVENLDLQAVDAGGYRLICLPLRYEGGDGSPVRAVLETS